MSKPVEEEPTIGPAKFGADTGRTEEHHPAYGMIRAGRVSGSAYLFGSDFRHHHYVIIELYKAHVTRDLSHDWPHPERELFQVALSEAQWATFVSSLNAGSGTQCTIERLPDQSVPSISRTTNRREQFNRELKETVDDSLKALRKLHTAIESNKVLGTRAKNEMVNLVAKAIQELEANVPFVAKTFDEHLDRTTERAKAEVNAYVQHVIVRAGLKALGVGEQAAPLVLEGQGEEKGGE